MFPLMTRAQIERMFGMEKPEVPLSKFAFELPSSVVQMLLDHDARQRYELEQSQKRVALLEDLVKGASRRITPGIPTRAFVAKLVALQFNGDSPANIGSRKSAWHYGKVEVRELLDVIYGGPPTRKNQYI